MINILLLLILAIVYPFLVLFTAKLIAYGWCRGKEEFEKQEKPNGNYAIKKEREETTTGLR